MPLLTPGYYAAITITHIEPIFAIRQLIFYYAMPPLIRIAVIDSHQHTIRRFSRYAFSLIYVIVRSPSFSLRHYYYYRHY